MKSADKNDHVGKTLYRNLIYWNFILVAEQKIMDNARDVLMN